MFGKKGYEPLKSRVLFPLLLLAIVPGLARANNLPPLASFTDDVNRDFFFAGESVTFDGSASIDQDEGGAYINYYRWRVDGVIVHQGSSASQYTTSFSLSVGQSSKTIQVSLEVRDDENTWTTSEGKMTKTYTIRRGQDRHFYVKDHLGSVRVTVDEEGEPLGFDDYYPYGLQMPTRSSNTANPNDRYKFTGHERDTEAGLNVIYAGARYLDPMLGTWYSIDPFGAKYPSYSPYNYVLGNPINGYDPNGLWVILINFTIRENLFIGSLSGSLGIAFDDDSNLGVVLGGGIGAALGLGVYAAGGIELYPFKDNIYDLNGNTFTVGAWFGVGEAVSAEIDIASFLLNDKTFNDAVDDFNINLEKIIGKAGGGVSAGIGVGLGIFAEFIGANKVYGGVNLSDFREEIKERFGINDDQVNSIISQIDQLKSIITQRANFYEDVLADPQRGNDGICRDSDGMFTAQC